MRSLILASAVAISFALPAGATESDLPTLPPIEKFGPEEDEILLTPENIAYAEAAARLAAHFMASTVTEDGRFLYEFDFITDRWTEGDNIVRQAGAISALAAYLHTIGRDPVVEAAVVRALTRMRDLSIPYENGQLVSGSDSLRDAMTGATALALHGELLYAAATGDTSFADNRRDWLAGIAAHWDPARGMRRDPLSTERSPYFDGEAWLAIATYNRLFPDDIAARTLVDSMDAALMAHYGVKPNVSFFHWGQLAARERFESTGDPVFVAFAGKQTHDFKTRLRSTIDPRSNSCYSIEGLAAAWHTLENAAEWADFRADLRNRVLNEQHKNAQLQIRPGQTGFETAPGVALHSDRLAEFAGAYMNGRYRLQTRVDFTQHCLNAWLQMLR